MINPEATNLNTPEKSPERNPGDLRHKPSDYWCEVLENQTIGHQLKRLVLKPLLEPGQPPFQCLPGQFVMLDLPTTVFFLRRPMSVMEVDEENGSLTILYKIHGQGTALLGELVPGNTLWVLGPLGNTFTLPRAPEKSLLIGGGIGIAPMVALGQALKTQFGKGGHCLYGVRNQNDLGIESELRALFGEQLYLSTDDGSTGFQGHVGQCLNAHPTLAESCSHAYLCGPTPMMKAVSRQLKTLNPTIAIQVSLEERMPCGTGACSGCVIFRTDQRLPSKTCTEGPIFNPEHLIWPDEMPAHQKTIQGCCPEPEAPCPHP